MLNYAGYCAFHFGHLLAKADIVHSDPVAAQASADAASKQQPATVQLAGSKPTTPTLEITVHASNSRSEGPLLAVWPCILLLLAVQAQVLLLRSLAFTLTQLRQMVKPLSTLLSMFERRLRRLSHVFVSCSFAIVISRSAALCAAYIVIVLFKSKCSNSVRQTSHASR